MLRLRRRGAHAAAVLLAFAVVVAGCSDGGDDTDPDPESDIDVPEGITLTPGGATIDVGRTASVVHQPDNAARTVVTVRVDEIRRGSTGDLDGVSGVPDGAVPFYAETTVRNAGPARLGGPPVSMFIAATSGDAVEPVDPAEGVGGCKPFPSGQAVALGRTVTGCLVFAVPEGESFSGVQVGTKDLDRPVTWKP